MTKAQKRARQILRKYNLSTAPTDLNKILEGEKLTVDKWSFIGRVKEIYLGDSIGIERNAEPKKQRELIAHALCHHFLHAGNHFYFETRDQFTTFKQEHEAQCFAAELLMPKHLFNRLKHARQENIEDYFDVEEDLIQFRFNLSKKGETWH
jgi:Zn-dependent peptidase ImmA (M78 family)